MVVYLRARAPAVVTIDGRETAPAAFRAGRVHRPGDRQADPVRRQRVTSGLAVGVPGHARDLGRRRCDAVRARCRSPRLLEPAIELAQRGFAVDQTFHDQTGDNPPRFDDFTSTARALPARTARRPAVGSMLPQPRPRARRTG